MRRLVYAFYDHGFSFRKLVNAFPKMKDDVTDCLTGDLFRDFDELYDAIFIQPTMVISRRSNDCLMPSGSRTTSHRRWRLTPSRRRPT